MGRAVNIIAGELLLGLAVLAAGLAATAALVPVTEIGLGLSLSLYGLMALVVWRALSPDCSSLGWPNRVTLLRGLMLAWLAAWTSFSTWIGAGGWIIVAVALSSLLLDGVDGYLARRLDQASNFGARFDMEVDAALILLLCVLIAQAGIAGPWVLLIGLMRYAFTVALMFLPRLNQALPDSTRRKVICVWQVASLIAAFVPGLPSVLISSTLALALALLVISFALDIRWLYRHRLVNSSIERSVQ